jgi:hypothetical protein
MASWARSATAARRAADSRLFEREQAAESRIFERRADAYVEVVTALNRTQDKVRNALPVFGWHKNPFDLTDEERTQLAEEARRVDALVVAFGSAELRDMLDRLRRIENRFFVNAERYEREGGDAGPDKFDRYHEAEEIRKEHRELLTQIVTGSGRSLGRSRLLPPIPPTPTRAREWLYRLSRGFFGV